MTTPQTAPIRPNPVEYAAAAATLALAIMASAIVAKPAWAASPDGASAWNGDSRAAIRLIPANGANATRRAGVEIKLAPGWKTYWRYPGDSGVPPHFDFSKSENVKSATVLWPAPQRFTDPDGATIGYKDRIVFPVHIVPRDAAKPVTLRLALDYAICEKLCVPAHGTAEIVLDKSAGAGEAAIAEAEARVPKRVQAGSGDALSVKSVRREDSSPARVVVDVLAPADATVTLFAEGPTPDWALPLPEPVPGTSPGLHRFSFALDGLPSGATARGAMLTLTATAGDRAIEVPVRLD